MKPLHQIQEPSTVIITVEGAVGFLNSFRLPLTFGQAANYLKGLWHSANLLALYRHYFPTEFAASISSERIEIVRGSPEGLTCLYSPKEKEFLKLVDEKLFPFYADHLLDEEEEREDLIYLPNFGVDWWSSEFEELERGWQLLLFITGNAQDEFNLRIKDPYPDPQIKAVQAIDRGCKLDWERLKATCAEKDEPLRFLPLALDMLDHDTGNIFLDPTDEMPADPLEWSIEDMDFLIEQYKEAAAIHEKAGKFLDWLTAGPHHLEEVIKLWNQCQQQPGPEQASNTARQP